ncbi:hypothetical protein [Streptosporangium sp. NPDC023615]|uniref:hypothetical protein n=1 Tax=Streptosporangium sp. NPDC023615 TaxID=3154794 RepID=UPI0034320192
MTSGLDRPARWAAGTTFVPTGDGWLVHGPDEDFMVVQVPPQDRAAVAGLISGELGVRAALERVPDAADLIAELATAPRDDTEDPGDPGDPGGVGGSAAAVAPPRAAEVLLAGDGPLLNPLVRHLRRAGLPVRRGEPGQDVGPRVTALVACAEYLPDTAWRELDARCRDLRLAWHRGHSEGRRWYVGPFTPPTGGAGYGDVRLRRLAACPWPDELAAYWAFLEAGGRPATPADPAGAEVAAALVAADLRAWFDGAPVPGAGHQVGVDLAAGEIRRHPVLAVPRGLMRETPA